MKFKITGYKMSTYESKAFRGTFSCIVSLQDKETDMDHSYEVKDLVHFDNGNSKWIGFPEKRKKDEQGNYIREYAYFVLISHKNEYTSQILKEVEEFVKTIPSIRNPNLNQDSNQSAEYNKLPF